jgi:hypothetical protein
MITFDKSLKMIREPFIRSVRKRPSNIRGLSMTKETSVVKTSIFEPMPFYDLAESINHIILISENDDLDPDPEPDPPPLIMVQHFSNKKPSMVSTKFLDVSRLKGNEEHGLQV